MIGLFQSFLYYFSILVKAYAIYTSTSKSV